MKTITFYSYKGGVGRSLALCNVANRLSEFGKKVCIMDFDLEAPGVHLKFERNIGFNGVKSGLVDYIHAFSVSGEVPPDIKKYVTNILFNRGGKRSDISLIAAGNTLTREYWRKLSAINWNHFFYDENSVGVDFFYNLKEQIRTQINPDFLLIDSRTGITDISGVTMSILADEVVLLAANNKENLEGIGQVLKTLAVPANSIQGKVPGINFVLCRIPYFPQAKDKPKEINARNSAQKRLNAALAEAGIDHVKIEKVLVIHSDPELELQERLKISYEHDKITDTSVIPIGLDYLELFEEITHDVISDDERSAFNEFLKAEFMIAKALSVTDPYEKIKGLLAALEINPGSNAARDHLAWAYYNVQDYEKSLEFTEQVILNDPKADHKIYNLKGTIKLILKDYEAARSLFQHVLKEDAANFDAMVNLGCVFYRLKAYDDALALQGKAIEYFPDIAQTWNDYANTLRIAGRLEEAADAVYRALDIDPQDMYATGTLAEIYAAQGNYREFYKNLDLSFSFGMTSELFQTNLDVEEIYKQFRHDKRFKLILDKYNLDVDLSVLS